MRSILIWVLAATLLSACGQTKGSEAQSIDTAGIDRNLPKNPDTDKKQPEEIPLCIPPSMNDSSRESYIPLQTYSANDFNLHVPLKWCTNGKCDQSNMPAACNGKVVFHDFTVYSESSATFFDSIPEAVSVNTMTQEVTLTSDTTGHKSFSFKYKYLKDSKEWLVTYADNCQRLYQYAFSP